MLSNFIHVLLFTFSNILTISSAASTVDIKIGFLVGSKRQQYGQTYSRPGRHLIHVFNYGIREINRNYSGHQKNNSKMIKFIPTIAETYGNESESIRQTIALITKYNVDFIVGPQETCQVESRIASVFDIGMVSHFCTQIKQSSQQSASEWFQSMRGQSKQTYIQTKPPYWKIVQRVTTLVSRLIHLQNWYPQQLVLLYFRESPVSGFDKRLQLSLNSSNNNNRQKDTSYLLSNEAIQYKLLGELLEIKLNELLRFGKGKFKGKDDDDGREAGRVTSNGNNGYERGGTGGSINRKPLVILNWHTTFHYGYTKNPFRQLIRRYLFQQQSMATEFVNQSLQCNSPITSTYTVTTTPNHYQGIRRRRHDTSAIPISSHRSSNSKLKNSRASIYIVVGHYYEHLGLMLALNELGLLGSQQQQQQHLNQNQNQPQEQQQLHEQRPSVLANQQESLVIGVDIEQYDERDDSVRFLRGLLMDESGNSRQQQSRPDEDLDSIASIYRRYLGVVPAKPTKSAEFLNDIGQLYAQSSATDLVTQQQQQQQLHARLDDSTTTTTTLTNQTPTTIDSLQLTHRILQLIRLPVEAFYLHDSVKLLGAFFNDCITVKNLTLNECRQGSRAFEWFKDRKYISFVNQNLTNFDSQAQTEGLYTLITRKLPSNDSSDSEDEFGLVPIGRFLTSIGSKDIVFDVDFTSIDPIWLPLWCDISESNHSKCVNISDGFSYDDDLMEQSMSYQVVTGSIFLIILIACLTLARLAFGYNFSDSEKQFTNHEWFNLDDEKNFLNIVHNYLISVDANTIDQLDHTANENNRCRVYDHFAMIELHCYMFPFPSCKFVHWLTALHQIKEMMFQYQVKSLNNIGERGSRKLTLLDKVFEFSHKEIRSTLKNRNFFTSKHKGTGSLRLLLNKYKTINECFCRLTKLDHELVAKLKGVTSIYGRGDQTNRMAHLIMEQPERGNLRECFKLLSDILGRDEVDEFKRLILLPLICDLVDGLEYLHKSSIKFHGELRSTTCMLTLNWRLKLSGFQILHLRRSLGEYEQKNLSLREIEGLIYSAPEVLENYNRRNSLSFETLKLADIYSLAFVIYEMFVDEEPWSCLTHVSKSKLLIERVRVDPTFRPPLSRLDNFRENSIGSRTGGFDTELLKRVIRSCWSHSAEHRPQSIETLKSRLKLSSFSTKNSESIKTTTTQEFTSNTAQLIAEVVAGTITTPTTSMKCILPDSDTAIASSFSNPISPNLVSVVTFNHNQGEDQYKDDDYDNDDKVKRKILQVGRSDRNTNNKHVEFIMRYYIKVLERSSMLHRIELHNERQTNKLLRMKLLPKSIVLKLDNGEDVAPAKKYDCISLCAFRFIITSDHSDELLFIDFLNRILFQLDKLVESYQNHIHLLDSQVDSSIRFVAFSAEPELTQTEEQQDQQHSDSTRIYYNHPQLIASFALQLIDLVKRCQTTIHKNSSNNYIQLSCGLHSGPVLGGMLLHSDHYVDKFNITTNTSSSSLMRYVLLGSTMCLANILERTCHAQKIQISSQFNTLITSPSLQSINSPSRLKFEPLSNNSCQGYVVIKREGKIQAEKYGEINTFWLLNGPRLNATQSLMMIA